jgi:hypothetical protein
MVGCMTTYDYEQLWFDEITTEGRFDRGAMAMEVVFEDDHENEYVWCPEWDDVRQLYATAEKVEGLNEGGGEELERLKALQRFSRPTLTRLAKCIDLHTSLTGIQKEFEGKSGKASELADKTYIADVFHGADVSEPEYPDKFVLSERWKHIREHLQGLNEIDYHHIINVIEVLVHRRRHVDAEERRRTIIEELNKVLMYESFEIGLDGSVHLISDHDDK